MLSSESFESCRLDQVMTGQEIVYPRVFDEAGVMDASKKYSPPVLAAVKRHECDLSLLAGSGVGATENMCEYFLHCLTPPPSSLTARYDRFIWPS